MKIPKSPPPFLPLGERLLASPESRARLQEIWSRPGGDGAYVHWDKLLHLAPPGKLSHEEWWFALKTARMQLAKELPLRDKQGNSVHFGTPDSVLELLSAVDRNASGRIQIAEEVTNPETRDRYIVSSLIEEAITSSQLEGAAVTRDIAKKMIRSGRKPRDKHERMVLNNYEAIEHIRGLEGLELTPERVLEIHRIVSAKTLGSPEDEGRYRRENEDICVTDDKGTVLYLPPPADELPARMQAMCDFANGVTPGYYLHDVVRSILLHFWLAYDHPFVDGNGRTARALFYWSMLSRGYWLTQFLSISSVLRKRPARYGRSFLYTETDGNDATYFVLDQLQVLNSAIQGLHTYLAKKMGENRKMARLLDGLDLNHRQQALLSHALDHAGQDYTIQSHLRSHGVVYQTARTDLLGLESLGLLTHRKVGNRMVFSAVGDLPRRLSQLRGRR